MKEIFRNEPTYVASIWSKAMPAVMIMLFFHLLSAIAMTGIVKELFQADARPAGLNMVFNWFISRAIVTYFAGKKQIRRPFLLGLVVSGAWVVLSALLTLAYFWIATANQ